MSSSPGVVLVSKFVSAKTKKFGKYVDYINRDEAARSKNFTKFNVNTLDGYNHYMENPEKSTGIFTKNKSNLTENEKKELKKIFHQAQENDSIMWQDVISFRNDWLEEHGIYNSKSGWINEGRLQESVREGMAVVLKEENMEGSGVWTAAIHFNTDNIHVHIALVEPFPTKKYGVFKDKETGLEYSARRGNRKLKTLEKFKSKVANHLLDRNKELEKITSIIHKRIAPKELKFKPRMDNQLLRNFNEIYSKLPNDTRLWKYNNNAMSEVKPQINSVIKMYLEKNHTEEMKEFDRLLVEEMKFRKDLYGDGDKQKERYKEYRDSKYEELYAKLGNTLLREMREIKKEEISDGRKKNIESNYYQDKKYSNNKLKRSDLNKIKRAFAEDYENMKNKNKYDKLQREIEWNKEH